MAFVVSNQQYVSGTARVKLYKGHAMIVGRKSEHSLYRHELATYEEGDQYDSSAAQGFIKIHGLGQTTQAKHQMLKGRRRPPPRAAQHHPAAGEPAIDEPTGSRNPTHESDGMAVRRVAGLGAFDKRSSLVTCLFAPADDHLDNLPATSGLVLMPVRLVGAGRVGCRPVDIASRGPDQGQGEMKAWPR